ncbi:MAG TPA: hypothetical protein VFS83_10410, partial [Ktedonobacterales bacterium]|nr:hypothetical protein [Ktedonobacterales bacterium]
PMTWDPYGHVAIVSHVYVDSNGNVTSIDIAQGNTPNLIQNLKVEHGVVDSPPGLGIQGFIRPPHP